MLLVLLALFVVISLALIDYLMRMRSERQLPQIPIISRIPVFGSLLALSTFQQDNLHLKFEEYVQRFGKNFYARIFGHLVVVTADARYVDPLLSSQQHTRKNVLYNMLSSWLGSGLLLSSGQQWHAMRKIITPAFHFAILERFVEVFDRQSTILAQKLRAFADGKQVVDIYPLMGLLTLDVIAETAMGVSTINAQSNAKSEIVDAVKSVTNILALRFMRPLLAFPLLFRSFKPTLWKKQKQSIEILHNFTENIIQLRRNEMKTFAANGKQNDNEDEFKQRSALLDILLQSTIDGKPLTDQQIRNEVNTFIFEGHDTTTSATSYCLYLLSRHAECQQNLFAEIRAQFGDDLERAITYRDLHDLTYLNCVVKEALRLYPPIPAIGRWLQEDFKIGDTTLPAGTNVIVLLWQLLRDESVYEEPERFFPERHLMQNASANAYSNIPFSAGPRNCIGQRFALFEMKTIIVKILRNYELLPLGPAVQPSIMIVLRSKTGVNLGIKPRLY